MHHAICHLEESSHHVPFSVLYHSEDNVETLETQGDFILVSREVFYREKFYISAHTQLAENNNIKL